MINSRELKYHLQNEQETVEFGRTLGLALRAGDVVLLRGDLGAGKTTLARGIAAGLGSSAQVSSPTFTLVHEYEGGRLRVVHIDAYRLADASDAREIGWEDYLRSDDIVVVEWPERIEAALPAKRIEIRLEDSDGDTRCATVDATGEKRKAEILAALGGTRPC